MSPATPKPYHPEADRKVQPWETFGPQEQERSMIKWLGRNFFEIAEWITWVQEHNMKRGGI